MAKAQQLANEVHKDQVDKAGAPYIGHLSRVAAEVSDDDSKIVAWLHDAVEDSGGAMTLQTLVNAGLSAEQSGALDALTRRSGEEYNLYLQRVCCNDLAVRVKRADIADNSSEDRLSLLDDQVAARLRSKYADALVVLNSR